MGGATEGAEVGGDPRLTERRNPRTRAIDRAEPLEIVDLILGEERGVPDALKAEAEGIAELIARVADRLRGGGRLLYLGAGTSGRLGVLDAAECPPTFGTKPESVVGVLAGGPEALVRSVEGAEDDAEAGRAAVEAARVDRGDVVLCIASSGTTPYVLAGLEEAKARGAYTAFLSCTDPPPPARTVADLLITPLVGPEVIAGSTRMKAGTATKLVLNAVTTGAMIRLGKVYENLMVDLRAVSAKLVDRSVRIVVEAGRVTPEEARARLAEAGGSAKTAIAMARTGVDRECAELLLDACDGFLGEAIERFGEAAERLGDGALPRYCAYPDRSHPSSREALVERLSDAPGLIARALAAAAATSDETLVPLPGTHAHEWHIGRVLEFERKEVRRWVGGPRSGRSEVNLWPDAMKESGMGASRSERLLASFAAERAHTLAALPGPQDPEWERRGRIGVEAPTLYQFLRGVAQQDSACAARIRERVHRNLLDPNSGAGV